MRAVANAKVDGLVDEVMGEFYMPMRKDFNDVAQGVSGKRRLLVIFQDECEKDLNCNKLTIATVEKIPINE